MHSVLLRVLQLELISIDAAQEPNHLFFGQNHFLFCQKFIRLLGPSFLALTLSVFPESRVKLGGFCSPLSIRAPARSLGLLLGWGCPMGRVRMAPQQALALFWGESHPPGWPGDAAHKGLIAEPHHTEPRCSLAPHMEQCQRVTHHEQHNSARQLVPRAGAPGLISACSGAHSGAIWLWNPWTVCM